MLVKTIKYTDYNGDEREEKYYFNLSAKEMMDLQFEKNGGFEEYFTNIINARDYATLYKEFKRLILMSYGHKSEDGRGFLKSEADREYFEHTAAFEQIIIEFMTEEDAVSKFIDQVMPPKEELDALSAKMEKMNVSAPEIATRPGSTPISFPKGMIKDA